MSHQTPYFSLCSGAQVLSHRGIHGVASFSEPRQRGGRGSLQLWQLVSPDRTLVIDQESDQGVRAHRHSKGALQCGLSLVLCVSQSVPLKKCTVLS